MLHLINFAFAGPAEARRCLARLEADDRVLFLGNGVFSPIKRSVAAAEVQSSLDRISVFALLPDLEIRGISVDSLISGIRTVDYSGFVALAADFGPVQSWFK